MTPCPHCATALAEDGTCPRCSAAEMSVVAPLSALRPEAEPPLPTAHDIRRGSTPPLGSTSVRANTPERKEPTPARLPQIPDPNSAPRALVVTGVPSEAAPGPMVDPKAWFEERQGRPADAIAEPAPLPTAPVSGPRLRVPSEIGVLMNPSPSLEPRRDESSALRELSKERPTARGIKSRPALHADPSPPPEASEPQPEPEPEPEPEASAHSDEPMAPPVRFPTAAVPRLVERGPWRTAAIAVLLCIGVGAAVGWFLSNASDDAKGLVIPSGKR